MIVLATPKVIIEGIDVIIKRDLEKHKTILERSQTELLSYREARSHEVKKKKHYISLIKEGKYNKESMERSIQDINVNIRHFSDKCKLTQDAIKHHTVIVDTLTEQLKEYEEDMKELKKLRR